QIGDVFARATTVLVPLYSKIRIAFEAVHDILPERDEALRALFSAANEEALVAELEGDVHLSRVQQVKATLRTQTGILPEHRADLLQRSLPRFLWVAEVGSERGPVLTLLFDATDLEQGNWLAAVIEYEPETCELLRGLLEPDILEQMSEAGFSTTTIS